VEHVNSKDFKEKRRKESLFNLELISNANYLSSLNILRNISLLNSFRCISLLHVTRIVLFRLSTVCNICMMSPTIESEIEIVCLALVDDWVTLVFASLSQDT